MTLMMNRATPSMRAFAKRLMIYERLESRATQQTGLPAAFAVCEKLRVPLTDLMGNGGYRSFMARSIALSNSEGPWLRPVRVTADGSLSGLEDIQRQLSAAQLFEGSVVLLAHLLSLLVDFIGDDLTLHLVCETWPNVPPSALEFDQGNRHEVAD